MDDKKMTVKEFWESKDKLAIHCSTRDQAVLLLNKLTKLDKHWCTGRVYRELSELSDLHYKYVDTTCYSNQGTYGNNSGFVLDNYDIVQFDDLEDFKQDEEAKKVIKEKDKVESKFKIGDKVRVRTDLNLNSYKGNDDSIIFVTNEMLKYKGQVFTINYVDKCGHYRLKKICYWWSDEMLELANKSRILDDAEFEYLWNIIKPFKDRVEYIRKLDCYGERYFISIALRDDIHDAVNLPYFSKDSGMYKGMEINNHCTLEELGFVEFKPNRLNCKVVCIESAGVGLTVGKIYEFKDGYLICGNNYKSEVYQSIDEFNAVNDGTKLLEIKE